MYLTQEKFSLWCDFVEKNFLDGEFRRLIEGGKVNGATSNPAIFKSAFLTSPAYQDHKAALRGASPKEVYESLAVADIKQAATVLLPQYEAGDDGFISIEVDPFLSDDAAGTIAEGKRLFRTIGMPNVMIKVPATPAGFEAMEALMSEGIHVNATLVFSPAQAQGCLGAFAKGARACKEGTPQGVISVFVSRFDRKLDGILAEKGLPQGEVGIMNAIKIYTLIEAQNMPHVRCLFASTGVKGEGLAPEYYVTRLLYPRTINTAPLETLNAFLATRHTQVAPLPTAREIEAFFASLEAADINMEEVYEALINEGLVAFHEAFKEILDALR